MFIPIGIVITAAIFIAKRNESNRLDQLSKLSPEERVEREKRAALFKEALEKEDSNRSWWQRWVWDGSRSDFK